MIRKKVQEEIIVALSELGTSGSTISEIAKQVKYERHTLSKYLSMLEAEGLLTHKGVGRAKLWFINAAPLETVLNSIPERRTFTESVLNNIISSLPFGLAVIDRDFNILFMNGPLWGKYGQKKGEKFYEAILGLEHPVKLRKIAEVLAGTEAIADITIQDRKDRTLSIRASMLPSADKSVSAILIIEDITLKRRAQEETQVHRSLLEAERQALERGAIVAETDLQGRITFVNEQFVKVSGYSREELMGKTHKVVNSGTHPPEFFRKMWKTLASGKVWTGVICNRRKDGKLYWVESALAPVLGKNGKPVKYLAVRFDITKFVRKPFKNE